MEKITREPTLADAQDPGLSDPDLSDLSPPITERRAPKSFKRAPEAAAEDADEEIGDTDEAVVEEAASAVLTDADQALESENTADAITPTNPKSRAQRDLKKQRSRVVLQKARERGITDVNVQSASSNNPTVVKTKKGKEAVVKLEDNEKSREVKVGDETVLVLKKGLNKRDAKIETAQFVAEKLDNIAYEFGLDDIYEPFFQNLISRGDNLFVPYYGEYFLPQLTHIQTNSFFAENDRKDLLEYRRKRREKNSNLRQ